MSSYKDKYVIVWKAAFDGQSDNYGNGGIFHDTCGNETKYKVIWSESGLK